MGVLLDAAARPIHRSTPLSRRWALAVAGIVLGAVIALLVWLVGSQVQSQIGQLITQLSEASRSIEQRVGVPLLGDGGQEMGVDWTVLQRIASYGITIIGALGSLVLVIAGGFFLAADPRIYRRGVVKLLPKRHHARAEDALEACGDALRFWLLAELVAMTIVGVLVGLGTWLIGLEAPLALGLFAGVTEFVPIIGPIIGAIPALILSVQHGTMTFVWTLLLFLAVQQLESNIIIPLVQRRAVTIPPALLLFAVFLFGLLFGVLGVIIAAPLTVVLYVAVKKLYLRQTLGEETEVPRM